MWLFCGELVMPLPFMVGRRIVVYQDAALEAAMVSWLEELDRREARSASRSRW
ncbi:hypothetical protein [Streptomyces pseudovenezuelae]|uniref:Uncharacterized protein n=1 Tax=Streptomyces pseudovenezuelae TaxID=67350 RepID=A0ABT6LJY6_9ACTN|nr:hypothetical protein [Streptomyces pseudovenezuelae]MDH6216622.1 hypothetical protein [Streptomyces pseudovenezuelae]